MNKRWAVYAVLVLVFVASFAFVSQFPHGDVMQLAGGIPGVLALLGILFQLLRDEFEHQRELLRQHDQQLFDLGATSHMANTAFDKHVAFCEEYAAEMHKTVHTLFRDGPSRSALDHASNLFGIRQKHATWLTPEMEQKLEPFEGALRRIGATSHLHSASPGEAVSSGRLDEMYDIFSDVVGIEKEPGKSVDKEIASSTILSRLREVLGTEQLTRLRQELLRKGSRLSGRGHR